MVFHPFSGGRTAVSTLGLALLVGGCGQSPAFNSTDSTRPSPDQNSGASADAVGAEGSSASGTATTVGADQASSSGSAPASSGAAPKASSTNSGATATGSAQSTTVVTSEHELDVVTDTLYLGQTVKMTEPPVTIPAEPLGSTTATQNIGLSTVATVPSNVAARGPQVNTFDKVAPAIDTQTFAVSPAGQYGYGKPVDIYVEVQNTAGVLGSGTAQTRIIDAVNALVTNFWNTNWIINLGGLPGLTGSINTAQLAKTSTTSIGDAQAKLYSLLYTSIWVGNAAEDTFAFRGINKLVATYAPRSESVRVYGIMASAANCEELRFDTSGNPYLSTSPNCSTSGPDLYNYMISQNDIALNMSVFFTYYKQTNTANCSSMDLLETSTSQYAEFAAASAARLFPQNPPKFSGDLCAATEDLSWVGTVSNTALNMSAHDFIIYNKIVTLGDPRYDFQIDPQGSTSPLPTTDFSTIDVTSSGVIQSRFVSMSTVEDGDTVVATYPPSDPGYRTRVFNTSLPIDPTQAVTIQASGVTPETCTLSPTGDPSVFENMALPCQFYGSTVAFPNIDNFLPVVAPNAAPLPFTVSYTNEAVTVTTLTLTPPSPLIADLNTQVTLLSSTGGAPVAVSNVVTTVVNSTTVTFQLQSGGFFPVGTYSASFYQTSSLSGSYSLNGVTLDPTAAPAVVCVTGNNTVELSTGGNLEAANPAAVIPCTYSQGNVTLSNEIPVASNGQRTFTIGYKSLSQPQAVFPLHTQVMPDADSLVVTVLSGGATQTLTADKYSLATGNPPILNLGMPLEPGETLDIVYTVSTPIVSKCLVITGTPISPLTVTYGPADNLTPLAASDYTYGNGEVCLISATPNNILSASYTTVDKTTTATSTAGATGT